MKITKTSKNAVFSSFFEKKLRKNVYRNIASIYIIWYNILMKKRYRDTGYATSYLTYYIVFCTRFKRKIFLLSGVENRFREITTAECNSIGIKVNSIVCDTDHVYLDIDAPPDLSVKQIVIRIKAATSIIMDEFHELKAMQSLWTFNYLASTRKISGKEMMAYVKVQKKRSGKIKIMKEN